MFEIFYLVTYLAITEAMALLSNNVSMYGRLIWLFRHLENYNGSIISDSIGRYRMLKICEQKKEYHNNEEDN